MDRVRVSLFWDHVAPGRLSQRKPRFPDPGPTWPGAYPRGSWTRYDRIVLAAQRTGVGLLFSVTGPAPEWATPGDAKPVGVRRPSPPEFRAFVKAAGIRYSGAYPIDSRPPPPRRGAPISIGGIELGGEQDPPQPAPGKLPRVDHWSVWNEPNYPQWLSADLAEQPAEDGRPDGGRGAAPLPPARGRRLVGPRRQRPRRGHDPDRRDRPARRQEAHPARQRDGARRVRARDVLREAQLPALPGPRRPAARLPGHGRRARGASAPSIPACSPRRDMRCTPTASTAPAGAPPRGAIRSATTCRSRTFAT